MSEPVKPLGDILRDEFRALLGRGLTQASALQVLGLYGDAANYADAVAEARTGCNDELEIDDLPMVSVAEDGTGLWVSAWIWVAAPEPEEGA